MAWGKAGSTTLGSAGDTITVSGMTASESNVIMLHKINSGNVNPLLTFNSDSGSNYAWRYNNNGGTDATVVNGTKLEMAVTGATPTLFNIFYSLNISTEEKLLIGHTVEQNTAGAGTAPQRMEVVSKWANTSDQITTVSFGNDAAGDYAVGSNVSVLGSDLTPAAEITFPTNVQVGSRAEITDSRKMYNYGLSSNVTESTDGSYTVLKFTGDATFTPSSSFNVDYLVVGGGASGGGKGGSGSGKGGGGGGAGQLLTGTSSVTAQSYSITVGSGGAAQTSQDTNGNDGSSSVFNSITSLGGGGGASGSSTVGSNGGSGGGGSSSGATNGAGGSGQATGGNDGGAGGSDNATWRGSGGGGGAGNAGSAPVSGTGGAGGAGSSSSITGTATFYAAGGGGHIGSGTGGTGGSSIGGNGGAGGASGTDATGYGSGGGGAGFSASAIVSGAGSNGVVILRFLTSGNLWNASKVWQEIGA
jgi:hypothetical protein